MEAAYREQRAGHSALLALVSTATAMMEGQLRDALAEEGAAEREVRRLLAACFFFGGAWAVQDRGRGADYASI